MKELGIDIKHSPRLPCRQRPSPQATAFPGCPAGPAGEGCPQRAPLVPDVRLWRFHSPFLHGAEAARGGRETSLEPGGQESDPQADHGPQGSARARTGRLEPPGVGPAAVTPVLVDRACLTPALASCASRWDNMGRAGSQLTLRPPWTPLFPWPCLSPARQPFSFLWPPAPQFSLGEPSVPHLCPCGFLGPGGQWWPLLAPSTLDFLAAVLGSEGTCHHHRTELLPGPLEESYSSWATKRQGPEVLERAQST